MKLSELSPDDVQPAQPQAGLRLSDLSQDEVQPAAQPLRLSDLHQDQVQPAQQQALRLSDLHPDRVQPAAPAAPANPSGAPTPEHPADAEELKQRNAIDPQEVEGIGAKHGLSKDQVENLKSIAPYLGAHLSDKEEGLEGVVSGAKEAVGLVGRAGLNIPQWLAKQTLSAPERAAWDEVQALADERKTGGRRAAEMAGELAVGAGMLGAGGAAKDAAQAVRAAPTLGKAVATGAAIGGAQGFTTAKEGEALSSTVKGAAFGAVTGGLLHGVVQGGKALYQWARTPAAEESAQQALTRIAGEVQQTLQDPEFQKETEAGAKRVTDLLTKATTGTVDDLVAPDAQRDLLDFANYLKRPGTLAAGVEDLPKAKSVEDAVSTLQEWAGPRGKGALEQEWSAFREVQATQEAAGKYVERGGGVFSNPVVRLGRKLIRNRVQFGIIDDRNMGLTRLEPLSDELAVRDTAFRNELTSTVINMKPQLRALQSTGLTSLDAGALQRIEQGDLSGLSREQVDALDEMSKTYESFRGRINKLFGDEVITQAKGVARYIPRMSKDPGQVSLAVRSAAQAAGEAAGVDLLGREVTEETLTQLADQGGKAWDTLQEQLKYLGDSELETPEELQRVLREAVDPNGAGRLETLRLSRGPASVALSRTSPDVAQIPDSLRETDLARLQLRWLKQGLQSAWTSDTISSLVKERGKLLAVNDSAGAEYLTQMLRDYAGISDSVPAAMRTQRAKFVTALEARAQDAERAGRTELADTYRFFSNNSDFAGILTSSMYPNMVGAKPSTVMKAVFAPLVSTFPEVAGGGTPWAMAKFAGGAMRAVQRLSAPGAAMAELEGEGFMPTHMSSEVYDEFSQGLERSMPASMLRKGIGIWSRTVMLPLQMAESGARVIARETASGIVQDLQRGSASAEHFVSRMGRGYEAEMRDLMQQGDWMGAEKTMQRFLVGKTLHYYTPTQMSELGRSLGRVVSAFGTWPTSVVGDIVRDYVRRGALGGSGALLRKQLAPLAALWAVQHFATAQGMGPDESPRARVLTGASGLTGASPLGESVKRMAHPMESPQLNSISDSVAAAVSMDPYKWWQQMNKVGETFVPFAGMVPLLDTTIPGLLGKDRPERSSISSRALNLVKPGAGTSLEETLRDRLSRGTK